MSLATNVNNLATRISSEIKSLRTLINGNALDNSALATTAKTSLVAAVNELKGRVDAAVAAAGAQISDGTTATTTTWSSTKITSAITAALNVLTTGAPAALDTLDELAAALGDDANFAATVTTALGNRVRVDAAQTFTAPQQAQARANIDAASATSVGDTTTDFVATFNAGLV